MFTIWLKPTETKSANSYFLTFDTVTNAESAFKQIFLLSDDYNVKFSYYRLFFTINGLTDSSDYNQVKSELVNYVTSNDTNVLFCKLYRKDNKFIGCGDLTVDTIEGMNKLLTKENVSQTVGDYTCSFYRYNGTKRTPKSNQYKFQSQNYNNN